MTDDFDIRHRIASLVNEERSLRDQLADGEIGVTDEHHRLSAIETELDQCWDLLRQRDALRAVGGDADTATVRPTDVVEDYLG